jgi:uroporphyrinogen-III synthase
MHTFPTSQALRGLTLLNTRPVGGGAALGRTARASGARVLSLPGASLRPAADAAAAGRALDAARRADVVVFTSPAAVRHALRLRPRWRPPAGLRVMAVGPATARALQRRGIASAAPDARFDSEGVLEALAAAPPRRAALIGAPGGRALIAQALRAAGVDVTEVHVYRRTAARLDARHVVALAQAREPLVLLLSSVESLHNLRQALPAAGWQRLQQAAVVASSVRVAAAARAAGLREAQVATSALTRDLLAAAARLR